MRHYKILTDAINLKQKLTLTYKNEPKTRIVYPHALYKNPQGKIVLDAYQVDGYSSTNTKFPEWKQFHLNEIKEAQIMDEKFHVVNTFRPSSSRYKKAITMIA